jgi:hypothetical protein
MIISYRSTNDLQLWNSSYASSPPLYSVPSNFSIIPRGPDFLNPADVNITLHENTALSSLEPCIHLEFNSAALQARKDTPNEKKDL